MVDNNEAAAVPQPESDPAESHESSGPLRIPPTFPFFIESLALQARLALGEIVLPGQEEGKAPEVDLDHAKYVIDLLGMLGEKTKGNLDRNEEDHLKEMLYRLRISFMSKQAAAGGGVEKG